MTTFTVAIPTHNRRETVVLSVQSLLRQSRLPEQIIVTCDGCTDGTADALRAFGDDRVVAVELEKGRGYAYGHRNVALEQATGDVILWLADDDLLLPDHLERLEQRWNRGDVDIVTTPAVIVEPDDGLEWIGRDWSVPYFRRWVLEQGNTNVMASVSVRTSLLRAIGGWDDSVERAADWELWKRALSAGARTAMLDEPTVLHFRATGRTQAWPLRVMQNEAWLARIGDAAELAALRIRLRRTRSEHEARMLEDRMTVGGFLEAEAAARRDETANLERHLHARRTELDESRAKLAADADHIAKLNDLAEHRRIALEAVTTGRWWRLRGTLQPAVKPARVALRWVRRVARPTPS